MHNYTMNVKVQHSKKLCILETSNRHLCSNICVELKYGVFFKKGMFKADINS